MRHTIKFTSTSYGDDIIDATTTLDSYEVTLKDAKEWYASDEGTMFILDLTGVNVGDINTIEKIETAFEIILNKQRTKNLI